MTNTPNQGLELLACPFCGATPHRGKGKVYHCQMHGDPLQDFSIWCPHNCAKLTRPSEIGAITAWNTRTTPTPASSGVLVEALERIAAGKFAMNEARSIARQALSSASTDTGAREGVPLAQFHAFAAAILAEVESAGGDMVNALAIAARAGAATPTPDTPTDEYRRGGEDAAKVADESAAAYEDIAQRSHRPILLNAARFGEAQRLATAIRAIQPDAGEGL